MSHLIFPELYYALNEYWEEDDNIKLEVLYKPEYFENEEIISKNTFFNLIFDENYNEDGFRYYFRKVLNSEKLKFPSGFLARLNNLSEDYDVYISCEETEENAENIFELTEENISLLNSLLLFRKGQLSSFDSFVYENLENNFSKLIYIYLDSIVNKNYENNMNKILSFSENNLLFLDKFVYLYVVNEIHYWIMDEYDGLTVVADSYLSQVKTNITEEIIENRYIVLNNPYPNSSNPNVKIYYNGVFIDSGPNTYSILEENGEFRIVFSNNFELNEEDKIIIYYNSSTPQPITGKEYNKIHKSILIDGAALIK